MTAKVEYISGVWPTQVKRLRLPAAIHDRCPICEAETQQDVDLSYPCLNTSDEYLVLTCKECESSGVHTEWNILLKLTVAVDVASGPRDVLHFTAEE